MAKSLAFWLESDNVKNNVSQKNNSDLELHFNYWLLNSQQKNELNYLDVGVKFNIPDEEVTFICIYFPFIVNKEKYLSNLGSIVCENDALTSAVFNSHIEARKIVGEKVELKFANNKDSKLVFHCQIEAGDDPSTVQFSNINEEDGSTGTIIKFPITLFSYVGHPKTEEIIYNYFRFRLVLANNDKNTLSQIYKPKDSAFNLRRETTEVVDFRVNEVRNLPARIRDKMTNNSWITCIHFFLIREAESEHKLSHKDFKRCRVLESNIWNAYLRLDKSETADLIKGQMLIYHWCEKINLIEDPEEKKHKIVKAFIKKPVHKNVNLASNNKYSYIDNFSAFAKFTKTTATTKTILWGIIIIFLVGLLSGLASSYIYAKLNNVTQTEVVNDNKISAIESSEGADIEPIINTTKNIESKPHLIIVTVNN